MSTPSAPVITSPHSGIDFYTNRTVVTFGGTVALTGVEEVLVNGSADGVTYVAGSGTFTADVTLVNGENTISFVALSDDVTPLPSAATTITVTYAADSSNALVMTNPTGLIPDVLTSAVRVQWVENPEPQTVGYNVYGSLTAGGGDEGYQKLNSLLISTVAEVRTEAVQQSQTISQDGDVRTTVTVEDIVTTNIYELTVDEFNDAPLTLGQTLHLVVTAVGFDVSNSEEIESYFSEEVALTPLILSEARVEAPTRTQQNIAEDYATTVQAAVPTLDIKPGTVTNDVHILPPSTEIEKLYFLLDFLSKAQSFAELLAIDDPNGDGLSDDVAEVPYKRALKAALSTDSDLLTQNFIDAAFTRLASNTGTQRQTAQKASNDYLFYTSNTPTTDVSIPAGSVVASVGNAEQGEAAQQYVTTATIFVPQELVSAAYNVATERFEFSGFIQAVTAGEAGNQDVGAINVVVSGPNITLQGENPNVLSNGTDLETNSRLALRSQLAFLGVDSGTKGGYLKTAVGVPSVERASVVSAGCSDMQRDFDSFRRLHMGCKVDVYIKGSTPIDRTDEVSFSYFGAESNVLTIISAAAFTFEVDYLTIPLSVSDEHPLFEVTEVRNVTQSVSYDVNRARFNGRQFTLDTTIPGNSGLVSTDVVQASFRWRDSDPLVLAFQPVESVTTVTGNESGPLVEGSNYDFDKSEDPLLLGNSNRSDDAVVLSFGPGEAVADESHTLNGSVASQLEFPDIDTSTIVVADPTGEITYDLDEDYVLDTFQCVEFEDEEHPLSSSSSVALDYDTVDFSTIEVRAGVTPVLMTEGVDYTVTQNGLVAELTRIVGGGISEGETVFVTYRIEVPILFTTVARQVGATPVSSITDGATVLVSYNKGAPRGRPVLVEDEEVVLVATEFVELANKGVIDGTIVVIDPLSASPNEYTEGVDYVVDLGTGDTATRIRRLAGGSIPDGGTVEVTYRTNEGFVIVYSNNDLVRVVQGEIEVTRHVTADVLVKQALTTPIDIEMTVVPVRGVNRLSLINNIRTAISRYFNSRELGEGIFQADIIQVIEEVTGVDHTVVPFLKMVRAPGSIVLREEHRSPNFTLWASDVSDAYRSQAGTLAFSTTAGGGSEFLPRGVYEDDAPLAIVDDISLVEEAFGRAYIAADGSIVISPVDGQPDNHTYTVTYQVGTETGVTDIRLTALECAELGELSISLSEPESSGGC